MSDVTENSTAASMTASTAARTAVKVSTSEVSIVIPARNEELTLPATLGQLRENESSLGLTFEIIVVNDGSTDRTADVAREAGALVVDVELHNIGAVRNAGAKQATKDVLIFVDADTLLPVETMSAALREIENGAVGGGAQVRFDNITWWQRALAGGFTFLWTRIAKWATGCFIYCRRVDFEAVGGFDEEYFASEERYLSAALRERGPFVILKEHTLTSGRKLRLFSTGQLLLLAGRALITDPNQLKRRKGLEFFYDAPRET